MRLRIKEILERSGMEQVVEKSYWFTCSYLGKDITIMKTCNNDYFTLTINGRTIATRCSLNTIIKKIKENIERGIK